MRSLTLTQISLPFFPFPLFNLSAHANTINPPPTFQGIAHQRPHRWGGYWEAADSSANTFAVLFCSNAAHKVQRTDGYYEVLKNLIQICDLCGVTEVEELPSARLHPTHLH